MGETSQRKIRTNLEASSKVETLSIFNAAQKFFRERTARLNAACNQMNALLKQLQSRKLPQCVWSIRRDVGQGLDMQETFHCGCYGALVARGRILARIDLITNICLDLLDRCLEYCKRLYFC